MMTEDLEEQATDAKNLMLAHLAVSGVITDEKARYYINNFAILIRRPGFFRRMVNGVFCRKNEDEPIAMMLVQRASAPKREDKNDAQEDETT
jgi:hypothetical protein